MSLTATITDLFKRAKPRHPALLPLRGGAFVRAHVKTDGTKGLEVWRTDGKVPSAVELRTFARDAGFPADQEPIWGDDGHAWVVERPKQAVLLEVTP
jgi:hypothetical protein